MHFEFICPINCVHLYHKFICIMNLYDQLAGGARARDGGGRDGRRHHLGPQGRTGYHHLGPQGRTGYERAMGGWGGRRVGVKKCRRPQLVAYRATLKLGPRGRTGYAPPWLSRSRALYIYIYIYIYIYVYIYIYIYTLFTVICVSATPFVSSGGWSTSGSHARLFVGVSQSQFFRDLVIFWR